MTIVGAGGVAIIEFSASRHFRRDFKKLTPALQKRVRDKMCDLLKNPMPPGLEFEKLKGYHDPDIYTIHVTGNYKVSMSIHGRLAHFRRVADHRDIDRNP